VPELQRLHARHAPAVLAFELANRAYFAAFVSDRGEELFGQFAERHSALLAEQEAGIGAFYVCSRLTPAGTGTRRARKLGMTGVDEMVAAAARQPGGTLMLRSDRLPPAQLADEVLARVDLRQAHGDGKRER
jgi:hypothetical protein